MATTTLIVKPDIPPGLPKYPLHLNRSILENTNAVDFLLKNGVSTGTLLNWSSRVGSDEKKFSILIPGPNLSGSPIAIKFVNNVQGNLKEQCIQQLQTLDLFISNLSTECSGSITVFLMLVVLYGTKAHTTEKEFCETIEDIRKTLVGQKESGVFKCVQVEVCSVRRTTEKDNTLKSDIQTEVFREILDRSMDGKSNEAWKRCVNEAIASVVPQQQQLRISQDRYNNNEDELELGFSLQSMEEVAKVFNKFFPSRGKELCTFPDPDFHSTPASLLHKTNERGQLDYPKGSDFLGEVINFKEHLLEKLKNPKGFLIHGYSNTQLNKIIREPYALNFELDWILCSHDKIYAIEISTTQDVKKPTSAIERKILSTFSVTLPKFNFIISSLLDGVEQRSAFVESCCEFVIYFTNITFARVEAALRSCDTEMKEVCNVLDALTAENIQKVTILCPKDAKSITEAPIAYKIVKKENVWTLERSEFTIENIFLCDDSAAVQKDCGENLVSTTTFDQKICQYISGLLSFGYLVCNLSIREPEKEHLPWNTKIQNPNSPQKLATYSNLVLSPQQYGILHPQKAPKRENLKILYISGEAGCGKTVILLAKMIEEARNPEVDTIVFFFPQTKTKFREFLLEFIRNNIDKELATKINVKTTNEVARFMKTLNLRRTVVLGDELYFDPKEHWSHNPSSFFVDTDIYSWLPLVRLCWLTNTEAGQDSKRIPHQSTLPHSKTKTLNILFRNSWHIGSFCTGNLHKNTAISKTTAWVYGCTNASQRSVFFDSYSDLHSLKEKLKECKDLRSHFNQDRMTVVFTISSSKNMWESELSGKITKIGDLHVVVKGQTLFDLSFTGIEKSSVLLIIDYCDGSKNKDFRQHFKLFNMAASRAQFELCIFTKESELHKVTDFLSAPHPADAVVNEAKLGLSLDLDPIFCNETMPRKVRNAKANEIIAIALQRENWELFEEVMTKSFKVNLHQVFGALDVPRGKKFLRAVEETWGKNIKTRFQAGYRCRNIPVVRGRVDPIVGLFNIGIRMGLTDNAGWLFGIIGDTLASYYCGLSGEIIYHACMNGDYEVIKWAVEALEKFGLLRKELEKNTYNTSTGEKITPLLLLCHMNVEDMRSIRLLREKGFPTRLLRDKFGGKNVLEKAVSYKNLKMTEELLRDDEWAQALLSSEQDFLELSHLAEGNEKLSSLIGEWFKKLKNTGKIFK